MTQAAMTWLFGSAADGRVPSLGASGAIAAVLGAYFVLYPGSQVLTWIFFVITRVPAWVFLGVWFLYQFFEANFGLVAASGHQGGSAFFAHVGGFAFGVLVAAVVAASRPRGPVPALSSRKESPCQTMNYASPSRRSSPTSRGSTTASSPSPPTAASSPCAARSAACASASRRTRQ